MEKDKKCIDDTVKVAVRIRPLVKSEIDRGCQNVLSKTPGSAQIVINCTAASTVAPKDMYTYNFAFAPDESQEMVYANAVKPIVSRIFDGYNVTILAYGQTGSGKTHTMGTSFDGTESDDIGVIPRAIAEIFDHIAAMPDHRIAVTCSFMELYQEQLYDLLTGTARDQSIVDIREGSNRGIFISNLTENFVTDVASATDCLIQGSGRRAVGATAMNATSSRSHAIFTINVQKVKIDDPSDATSAKFHLVDLAGSERSQKTKASGNRFKEGVKINQGLLALGNVISALGTTQPGSSTYINYRDSKLTRLLQDSLGGNSVTLMIACVSPADYNLDETQSTLRYADRARQIKNKPIVNTDPKTQEIQKLNGIIQQLRMELLTKNAEIGVDRSLLGNGTTATMTTSNTTSARSKSVTNAAAKDANDLRQQLESANRDYEGLLKKFEETLVDVTNLNMKLFISETANEELTVQLASLAEKINGLNATLDPAETCPAEFVVQGRAVRELKESVATIRSTLQESIREVAKHQPLPEPKVGPISQPLMSMSSSSSSVDEDYYTANEEEAAAKATKYRNKQIDYQEQLRTIQEELALKSELHERMNINVAQLNSYNINEQINEFVAQIAELERELSELKAPNINNKVAKISAKLAEDRRCKIRTLETELEELRRRNHRQGLLLNARDRDQKKVNEMEKEIANMKQKKVQLIKAMKTESEEFRKWKMNLGREILQLRAKDRKRDVELYRSQQMHERQKSVLKRKVDEAMMSNKRLKDALDKHRLVQSERKKSSASSTASANHVGNWIDNEIEMIYSIVDAKHANEQLIEDRAAMNMRLLGLRKKNRQRNLMGADKILYDQLTDEIGMRNAQIADMQEKIKSSDVDAKIRHIADSLTSMPEARAAVKHLFVSLSDLRTEFDSNCSKLRDLRAATEANEERENGANEEWRQRFDALQSEHDRLKVCKAEIESSYELKVTMLLHELNDAGKLATTNGDNKSAENNQMQAIYESTLSTLREKIERYEAELKENREQLALHTRHLRAVRSNTSLENGDEDDNDDMSDDEHGHNDSSLRDPDWHNTPAGIKQRKAAERRGCSCKSQCKGNCGCRRNQLSCGIRCKCPDSCQNNKWPKRSGSDDEAKSLGDSLKRSMSTEDQKENANGNNQTTIKRIKLQYPNETTTTDADVTVAGVADVTVAGVADVTTTPYPYNDKKKRKPLLND